MPRSSAPPAPTTRDLLKQQFDTLCRHRDAALAQVAPLRAERDAAVTLAEAALAAKVAPLDQRIATLEATLPLLLREIAQVSTALGGETA